MVRKLWKIAVALARVITKLDEIIIAVRTFFSDDDGEEEE